LTIPPQLPNLSNHCFITPVICHNSRASLLLTTKIRQLYYSILVVQSQHRTIEAKIRAAEDLQGERVQQVNYRSTLEVDLIESKAQLLQAKQGLLAKLSEANSGRKPVRAGLGLLICVTSVLAIIREPTRFTPTFRSVCRELLLLGSHAVEGFHPLAASRSEHDWTLYGF